MVAILRHGLSTIGRSTVAELMHALRTHHPDQEVVLSTESLPRGAARICVVKMSENAKLREATTLVRYCRNVDADAETDLVGFDQPQATERRRAIICPPVAVDGAVGGATVLQQGPPTAAVA